MLSLLLIEVLNVSFLSSFGVPPGVPCGEVYCTGIPFSGVTVIIGDVRGSGENTSGVFPSSPTERFWLGVA